MQSPVFRTVIPHWKNNYESPVGTVIEPERGSNTPLAIAITLNSVLEIITSPRSRDLMGI